jgi:hypothetical protein
MLSSLHLSSSASGNDWEYDLSHWRGWRRRDRHISDLACVQRISNLWRHSANEAGDNDRSDSLARSSQTFERDIRFLRLVNHWPSYIFKRVFGVIHRKTGVTKCQDAVVIRTVSQKRALLSEIPQVARTFFERRLVSLIDAHTPICTDVLRVIASFAMAH